MQAGLYCEYSFFAGIVLSRIAPDNGVVAPYNY